MSYCRWSSDGFQCDVYVYESADGYVTNVAGRRRKYRIPYIDFSSVERIKETLDAQRVALDDPENPLVDIGLSEDNKFFLDESASDCAERLIWLKSLGYNVPQYAIDALREEADDSTTNDTRD